MPAKKKTEKQEEKKKVGKPEKKQSEEKKTKAVKKKVEKKSETKTKKVKKKVEKKSEKQDKIKALKEKAKKLADKIEKVDTGAIKEKVKPKKTEMLVLLEDYMKTSTYLGTRVITPNMRQFVYKRRADGLAVLNTNFIDEKLREAIDFLLGFDLKDIIVVCKREAGWNAAKLFSEVTGIRIFTKKYPAGVITNINLPDFFEPELVVICDPWLDKNALNDAAKTNKKIISLCDTNNFTKFATKIIPCNNKSNKSLGLIFYIITREILKAEKIKNKLPDLSEFIGEEI